MLHAARLKYRTQKVASWAPSHNFVGLYLCNYGTYRRSEKKLVKQQYLFHMSLQYGELWATNSLDLLASLGHPSKFQPVLRLGFITGPTSLNGGQQGCLAVSWAGTLYIYFRRLLPCNGILPGEKFTLYPPSLALSYIGSITARHSSSGREPNPAAMSIRRHLYSAGRPSRWALAHILVRLCFSENCWLLVFLCFTHCFCGPHPRNIYV